LLMSDAGTGAMNGSLTFSDSATAKLSSSQVTTGIYRPTNLGGTIDTFPKPAPRGPYGSALSTFAGVNPSDLWLLYIRDDKNGSIGTLDGWQLIIDYVY